MTAPEPPRSRRRGSVVALSAAGVGVVLVALIVLLATSKKPRDSAATVLLGKPAPALVGTTLAGKPFSLSDYSGEFVLVNFFGSWCAPCVQEAPELRKWAVAHQAKGDAMLVNVVFNDTPAKVRDFFAQHGGYSWPVLSGNTDVQALDWGVSKAPETFLVTPSGYVVWHAISPVTASQLDQVLAEGTRAGDSGGADGAAGSAGATTTTATITR